jgi:enamine deaminase RidA (YjgF/YER057c/UK114 family)
MTAPEPTIRRLDPPELGPPPSYTQVVEATGKKLIFISGQTAFDSTGRVVGGNDCGAQAEQAFRNLGHALKAAACTASNLVKLTVFIRNMDELGSYRTARDAYFHEAGIKPPAVTLVEVSRLYAPELLIEIEAIAVS